jgi:uncharacterized protein
LAGTPKKRGFAAMDPAKRAAICALGGKAAHAKGTAHQFTSAEAAVAGSKGGKAAHAKGKAHKFTADEARAAGRKGGRAKRQGAADGDSAPTGGDSAPRPDGQVPPVPPNGDGADAGAA